MTWPTNTWLRCHRPRPRATTKLICFPHAGGAASAFRLWPDGLGNDVEVHAVQYPGREDRLDEPMIDRMDSLVDHIVVALADLPPGPFALLGHSMGGAVAYEVATRLRALGLPQPLHLFVSARQAPQDHRPGAVHTLGDEDLLTELVRLAPSNAALRAEPALTAIVLPVVRNDYRLIETYQPTVTAPLACPITVLAAVDDPELTPAQAAGWAFHTVRPMRLHTFPGDHFYLLDQRTAVLRVVVDTLRGSVSAGTRP